MAQAICHGRGVDLALCRAANFCNSNRQDLQATAVNLFDRRYHQAKPTQCRGGAMLAIDLSRAFDMVRHSDLYHSLRAAGVPQPLTQLVLEMHNQISYHIVSGHHAAVAVRRGVRQGCTIAPLLWNLVTASILRALCQTLPPDWILHCLTLFADDTLGKWRLGSEQDLDYMITCIHTVFQVLEPSVWK